MNHWPFIVAAYALTVLGTGGVCLWAFLTMRAAERREAQLGGEL